MFSDVTSFAEFMAQVFKAGQEFGGMSTLLKLSTLITLAVSSLKVAPITRLVWSKLGWAQVLVAPLLGLAAGLVALFTAGAPVTLPVLLAYLAAGGGAVFIHELLDGLKTAPGIGPLYVQVLDFIEGLVPASATPAAAAAVPTPPARDVVKTARASLDDRFGKNRTL